MTSAPPSASIPSAPTQGVSYIDERLLKAELAAVEARTETKFAQLLGELRVISTNVANLASQIGDVKKEVGDVKTATASVKWNILAAGIGVGALILGLFAFGQQMMQVAAGLVGLKP